MPVSRTPPVLASRPPQMLPHCSTRFTVAFNFYDQSSKCQRMTDSSVSYATALVTPAKAGAVAAGAGSADGGAPG